MKDFFRNNGLWILFAGAVIAVAMALLSYLSATSSPLVNVVNTAAAPLRQAYTAVATWFNDFQKHYQDTTELEAENAALRRQVAQMEETVRQAEADREENRRLRTLLELREQRRDFELESAMITEHAVSNWTSSLTLNKGTIHGVEVDDCVVDETMALVGIVHEVGVNWCTVLTIVDTDTSLGAQVFRTKELGLAEGDFSLMGRDRLRLDYVTDPSKLLGGDLVQTSGLGGYYPSGLTIGTVEEIQVDDSGAASYAVLAPKVDFGDLTEVFIIKSFDILT